MGDPVFGAMVAKAILSALFGSLAVVGILVVTSSMPSSDSSATATALFSFWPFGSKAPTTVTVSKCPYLSGSENKFSSFCTDKMDPSSCIKGVCQTFSLDELFAGIAMNVEGAANYFWRLAGSKDSFTYASDTTAWASYDEVVSQMKSMPAAFAAGKKFKANDLGLLRLGSAVFSYGANPAIALAAPLEMHAVLRPYLDKMFGDHGKWSTEIFKTEATSFLAAKKAKHVLTQGDIETWCQQMMHKYSSMGLDISEDEAAKMNAWTKSALISSILPAKVLVEAVKNKVGTAETRTQHAEYIAKYAGFSQATYPELTDEHAGMVAHGLIDGAFTFAGGLSVPGSITSMLGVMYSGVHGDFTAPEKYSSAAFAWEVVRLYPAVVGVPFVESGTTRRQDLLLPAALTDKKAWGEDANEFKLRDGKANEMIDVAWSGFTNDDAHPTENHSCPGMAMSKSIMLGFMQAFVYEDWELTGDVKKPKITTQAPIAWNAFQFSPK